MKSRLPVNKLTMLVGQYQKQYIFGYYVQVQPSTMKLQGKTVKVIKT